MTKGVLKSESKDFCMQRIELDLRLAPSDDSNQGSDDSPSGLPRVLRDVSEAQLGLGNAE